MGSKRLPQRRHRCLVPLGLGDDLAFDTGLPHCVLDSTLLVGGALRFAGSELLVSLDLTDRRRLRFVAGHLVCRLPA